MDMTKHVATCKNMADGCEQENMEREPTALGSNARTVRKPTGGATALGSNVRTVRKLTREAATSSRNARTVRKPTGETPGAQSIQNVTGTVTEERRVEETPLSTQEQVLQCLSTERCEVTEGSNNHTGKV